MDLTQVVELIATAGGIGGGVKAITKLTRIAVAVEGLVSRLDKVVEKQETTDKTVQDHEIRLGKAGL